VRQKGLGVLARGRARGQGAADGGRAVGRDAALNVRCVRLLPASLQARTHVEYGDLSVRTAAFLNSRVDTRQALNSKFLRLEQTGDKLQISPACD
jgi:hypothetical protein